MGRVSLDAAENDFCKALSKQELMKLVDEHLLNGDYETAVFWAEKIVAQSDAKNIREKLPELAHYMAALTAAGHWQMIITFISRHDLFLVHLIFAYFYVNALFNRSMYSEIINMPLGFLIQWEDVPSIMPDTGSKIFATTNQIRLPRIRRVLDDMVVERNYESRLLFILSKTYLMVQNRPAAAGCLKHCLTINPFSSEAVYLSLESRLLSVSEMQKIISSNASKNQSGYEVIRHILDIYNINENKSASDSSHQPAFSDLSLQAAQAFRLYHDGHILDAHKITSKIIHEYGYYSKCFLVHIGCLVELGRISELYELSHSLVRIKPEREITWYAVGCYYFATGQYTTAKKFLNKCTQMNTGFGEGWLAYGHALYYAEEHEQAMNCYLRASRILEGHFEPLLYIAVEYCFANNFKFATDFLQDAEQISGPNAIVLHEQATAAYMKEEFQKAEEVYLRALNLITTKADEDGRLPSLTTMLAHSVSDFWEPIYSNLGHTLRQLGKYEDAIEVHRKSLLLSKHKADPWGAIGICYASMGEFERAIEAFNNALALRAGDDNIKTAMDKVLEQAAKLPLNDTIFDGTEENLDTLIEQAKSKFVKPKKMLDLGGFGTPYSTGGVTAATTMT